MTLRSTMAADVVAVFLVTDDFADAIEYLPDSKDAKRTHDVVGLFHPDAEQRDDERGRGDQRQGLLILAQATDDDGVPVDGEETPLVGEREERWIRDADEVAIELRRKSAWLINGERWETAQIDPPQDGAHYVKLVRRIAETTASQGRTPTGR